jgi:oligopeptide transport system substrate-binding protein
LPSGTVTFLFTDIEGSTQLLQRLGDKYADLLIDQREILRRVFAAWEGAEVDTQGDAFFYSFPRATQAVNAAVEAQQRIAANKWPEGSDVRIRMGLHTGEPARTGGGYVGMDVHRAARIAHAGHGGQILLSETTTPLVIDHLPAGTELVDLGRHRLKDLPRPERIALIVLKGAVTDFPPLASLGVVPTESSLATGTVPKPRFLIEDRPADDRAFVGRERELEWLNARFEGVLAGQGGLALVVGGPGRGKTALLESFVRSVSERVPETTIAWGECSAYRGRGDPYLPFRQVFKTLTGDIHSIWHAGRVSRPAALQMWESTAANIRTVVERGPALIGLILSGPDLITRARKATATGGPWLEQLGTLARRAMEEDYRPDQHLLFEHVENVLSALAEAHPIVIVVDDMQWIDSASVDLLFHLSRELARKRILLLGSYRPEEVELPRGESPHPLRAILPEFHRTFGEATIDLGRLPIQENREFVEAYLDSEPNQLDQGFRAALFERTEGHPLFTVELLGSMVERGELRRDDYGRWIQGEDLNWEQLPARVEGVIEERLERLDPQLMRLLRTASVEGTQFTGEVLASVLELDEPTVLDLLKHRLEEDHGLIREQDLQTLDGKQLSRFSFKHGIFRDYIYREMGPAEIESLHARVGSALEQLYDGRADQIAPQLALHFQMGNVRDKAIDYGIEAGDQARLAYAHREGIEYYRRVLRLLEGSGQPELIARTLLKIGLIHNAQGRHDQANTINQQAFELWAPLRRAWELGSIERVSATLSIAIEEPQSLDPGIVSDEASIFLVSQLFEGLVSVDQESNVLPAAAARWEILDGGKRYRFFLNDGLSWSDGFPLTAQDFEFAWRRNLRLAGKSPAAHLLYVIKNARAFAAAELESERDLGIRPIDDHTLEVELEAPIAYLPHLLSLPVAYPLPSHVGNLTDSGRLGSHPAVTNGPYSISEWDEGGPAVLERELNYHGAFPGNLRRVNLSILDDYSHAFDQFDQGEVDIVNMIKSDPSTVRQASRRYGSLLRFVPQPATFYVNFGCDRVPFDDARVRRAFVHAIDRRALIARVSHGQYRPALGSFLPPGMPAHQSSEGLAYDPDQARALLADAGYPGGQGVPPLEILFTGIDAQDPLIEDLVKSWKSELGVEVQARAASWESFVTRLAKTPPQLSVMGYTADYPDPDAMLRILFHSEAGYNHPQWHNLEFDGLVEKAGRLLEAERRMACYQQADRILVSLEAAVMPVGYALSRSLIRPGIRVPPVPAGRLRLKEIVR